MARSLSRALTTALLAATTLTPVALLAQTPASPQPGWSQEDGMRIVRDVQKKLSGLTSYDVFDWITFGIQGKTIILRGYASRPILKEDAGRAVKSIPGVASVDNQIEVLPFSTMDDRVRAAVYNRIYTQPALSKYNANQGNLNRAIGPGMRVGGITNNPPIGYHAIHIIVKSGHVSLYGVVLNEGDATIANMQANSAPGAFSVDNNLVVEGAAPKGK